MQTMTEEQQKNWVVARQLNRETRADPSSPYSGKYLGVLGQQLVAVADTLEDLEGQLDALGDHAQEAMCIEASADYDRTYMIWGLH